MFEHQRVSTDLLFEVTANEHEMGDPLSDRPRRKEKVCSRVAVIPSDHRSGTQVLSASVSSEER